MAKILKPQEGPQEVFLSTPADIAVYGGAAGGGKTYALLLEAVRNTNNSKFGAVIFRKQSIQITQEGGLWDSSFEVYGDINGALPKTSPRKHWRFRSGARVSFAHIDGDKDLMKWMGSQIALIGYDELTHFTENQFFYMLSRNRSTCGVKPYVRATCNPDADSWAAKLISWWIDHDTGYPILERSGKIRYMARVNNNLVWEDSKEKLISQGIDESEIKSFTFIASTLRDNKILMMTNPQYYANLKALPDVERERLLNGNWKIKAAAGLFFKRTQVGEMLSVVPIDIIEFVRAWDLAATSKTEGGEPSYTSGVLMGKRHNGRFVIVDVVNVRQSAAEVRATIKHTAQIDNANYGNVRIRLPQDPGQAGKDQAQSFIKFLAGYSVKAIPVTGSKETRAEPVAAQWQGGNMDVVTADWNEDYFSQLESFPESKFKDMVDATSDAFAEIIQLTEHDRLVYSSFNESKNTYDGDIELRKSTCRRYIAINYGTVTPMSFLEIIDDGAITAVNSEYYYSAIDQGLQKSDSEYANDFAEFAGDPSSMVCAVLDEAAEGFKNELRNRGYRVKIASDDVRNDIAKVNTMFNLNKLLINRQCNRLIEELHSYIWDEKVTEHGKERPLEGNAYACGALRRGIATVIYTRRRLRN